ncbi:MAG: lipid-A-disaccharide synthase N-terminal domain-containing protein [Planctomycetes bacterium]|nr:lipid-A-disaccharide synthase N-terminal domain-containing protein [Planctomycetota bacterium]
MPTNKGSYIFLIIGFLGQIGFTCRFLVQWIASEKARESIIPESFWWLSIVGSILLLIYSISILAWPIILGQTPNVFIYSRNLYFIHMKKKNALNAAETKDGGEAK